MQGFLAISRRPRSSRAGVLASVALLACTANKDEAPGVDAEVIRVGTFGPLTGPQAAWGDSLRAMKAYFAWVSAEGGVHGRRIELYVKDDRYDPAETPAAVRGLIERDRVFAVVGGIGTATGRAAAPLLERAGVPFFTPASGAAWFSSDDGPSLVRTVYLPYRVEGRRIGAHLVGLGLPRVAVLAQNDDFGGEGLDGVRAGVEAAGGAWLGAARVLPSDTDVSGPLSTLLREGPDALVLYVAPRQAVLVGRALAGQPERPQLVTSFVLADPGIIERAGAEVWEGTLTSVVGRLPDEDHPAVHQMRRVLAAHAPGLAPGGFATSGFRFAQPFVEALERAGPKLDRSRFLEALETLDGYTGGGPHWEGEGLGPPVDFRGGRRLGVDRIGFARARDGRFVLETPWTAVTP